MPTIPIRWSDNTKDLAANLREGLNQIEATKAAADRMVKSLSGDRLITAAHTFAAAVKQLGGVEKLTNAERERGNALLTKTIEKYRALGLEAPQALHDLAAATTAVSDKTSILSEFFGGFFKQLTAANLFDRALTGLSDWTSEAIRSASATVDLSNKLGVSTDAVQRWGFAAKDSGSSADEFAEAAFRLGVRIAGGSGSVKDALTQLGLEWTKIRQLQPEQQFDVVNEKLEQVSDSQERNRLGVELYGKSFTTIAAAVAEGYTKIAKNATVASDAELKAIDRTSEAWDKFIDRQKVHLTSLLGQTVLAKEAFDTLTNTEKLQIWLDLITGRGGVAVGVLNAIREAAGGDINLPAPPKVPTAFTEELAKARAEVAKLTAEDRRQIIAAEALGKTTDDITNRFGISEAALRVLNQQMADAKKAAQDFAEAQKKAQQETEKWASDGQKLLESIDRLEMALPGLRQHVGELDTTEQKSIETFLANKKAADELYLSLLKLSGVKIGEVDTQFLPLDVETIGRLKGQLEGLKKPTDEWLVGLEGVSDVLQAIQSAGQRTFQNIQQRIFAVIQGVIQLVQNFIRLKQAIDAANTSAQISNALGLTLSVLSIAVAFIAKGGVVGEHGVQHFTGGGVAQPILQFARRGSDTVPAMLTPGEMVLNAAQQARLFQIADGRITNAGVQRFDDGGIAQSLAPFRRGTDTVQAILTPGPGEMLLNAQQQARMFPIVDGRSNHAVVQRFTNGGFAQSLMSFTRGTDTVPAMLAPGEMVLNAPQQARLFQIADGRIYDAMDRSGEAPAIHQHTHHWDLRQAVVTNEQGLDRLARAVARKNVQHIAQNKASVYTGGRAAYGLRS